MFRLSDRRSTLRPVSLLNYIEYEMYLKGSLTALYGLEIGLQVGLGQDLFG